MTIKHNHIEQIQVCVGNPLDQSVIGRKKIVGIIGDAPSHYAKSPPIWNAVFQSLKMDAVYLPFDVKQIRLRNLVQALKNSDRVMGANVTVPYKVQILDLLDSLDQKAAQIKAVNTIVRTDDGKLVGYNTDGSGFIESILRPQYGQGEPFVKSLKGIDVLMIGAGGSARAIAFYLAEMLGNGTLLICNRTPETAVSLAEEVANVFGNAKAINERDIAEWAPKVGLIVNCSTKGQGGIRKTSDGRITILEPYSALTPAKPSTFSGSDETNPELHRNWLSASLGDIEANNEGSLRLAVSIPIHVKFCDLIYFPVETVFLRHGRLSGHQTLNGKGMNVAQAADAFFNKVCKPYLQARKLHNSKTYQRVVEIMSAAW